MIKVNSYEEYRQILKEYKKGKKQIITNMYLMREPLKKIISEDRFFLANKEGALIFLVDEKNYYRLFFYQSDEEIVNLSKQDKEILIEIIYNNAVDNSAIKKVMNAYALSGARFDKKCHLYEFPIEKRTEFLDAEYDRSLRALAENGLSPEIAQCSDIGEIQSLWDQYLDKFDFEFITDQELLDIIDNQEIMVIKDKGHVIATISLKYSEGKILECHQTVSEKYRGMGLGKILLLLSFKKAMDLNIAVYNAWIDDENTVSINCHLKAGNATEKVLEHYII